MVLPEVQEVPPRILHPGDQAARPWRGSTSTGQFAVSDLSDDDDAEDEGVSGHQVVAGAASVRLGTLSPAKVLRLYDEG